MKKKYITPELYVVFLNPITILAASDTGVRFSASDADESGEVLTREQTWPKNSVWDEEW